MFLPLIEGVLKAFSSGADLAAKAIPDDALRMARFKARLVRVSEKAKDGALGIRLRRLKKLHRFQQKENLDSALLAQYLNGDTTLVNLLNNYGKGTGTVEQPKEPAAGGSGTK